MCFVRGVYLQFLANVNAPVLSEFIRIDRLVSELAANDASQYPFLVSNSEAGPVLKEPKNSLGNSKLFEPHLAACLR